MAALKAGGLVVSLSGSGHLLCYHLGVLHTLLCKAPAWTPRIRALAGTSGGAIAAAAATLLPPAELDRFAQAAFVGGSFNALARELSPGGCVSADAPAAASGALFFGATECETGRAALFGRYGVGGGASAAEQLLTCVLASAAIPRAAHPFDLLATRPRYPTAEGIIVPTACEWDGGATAARGSPSAAAAAVAAAPGESAGLRAYVDGGLSAALPPLPPDLGLRELTVSPISGPRGAARDGRRLHLCPSDRSWRLPVAPSLRGLRVYLSVDNAHAAQAAVGAPPAVLQRWYERGREDALELARASPDEAFGTT
jgi:hypothetical protein